ncbi:MAG: nitroreductase family protein [Candidatus Accumulibacter sp.]|jgi:nitroreductase|nr:nitroreductase family protein [Accumulibacter sp.]
MNDTLNTIANRYSCRGFSSQPVSKTDLEILVRAGVQAPSSRGNAPWYLAVVTNRELIDQIRDSAFEVITRRDKLGYQSIMDRGGDLFYNAQALIVVATKPTHDLTPADFDAGLLTGNICLAAHSIGLGTCICGFATHAFHVFKSPDGERFAKQLKFPYGYQMTVAILVGHPAKTKDQHPTDTSSIRFFE